MTRFERRLLRDTSLLGIALTLLTAVIASVGGLRLLELFLDDQRAAHFQFFRPPPTDQVVYVDIDDGTLDTLGSFPWPRAKLAKMVDEMNLAGARVVDMDVMFSEAQEPTLHPGEPLIDNDQLFADAMNRFRSQPGRGVLLPFSVDINSPDETDPIYLAMVIELRGNLELTDADLIDRLRKLGNNDAALPDKVANSFRPALESAMFDRIKTQLEHGTPADAESLRAILLPQSEAGGSISDAVRALRTVLPRVQAYESIRRFSRPVQPDLPHLLSRDHETNLPIAPLAGAAAFSGFVDFWTVDNNKIRNIPLWIIDRGRMVPQMALSLACAQLGVNTNDLVLAPDTVTIHCPNGRTIVIPVYTRTVAGAQVGMLMDIPWFGGKDWRTMYDYPHHLLTTQHIPLQKVWDICQIEPEIIENNRNAVEALKNVATTAASEEDAVRVRDHHPPFDDAEGWNKLISDVKNDLAPGTLEDDDYKDYLAGTVDVASIKDPKTREFAVDLHKVLVTPKVNDELLQQRSTLRDALRAQLNGKAALIGWIATGTEDFHATPIHQECPGVVVHGVIANAILTGVFLTRAPPWIAMLLTLFVGLLVTFVSAYVPGLKALFLSLLFVIVFLLFNFLVMFDLRRIEVDAAGPPTAAVLIWSTCTLFHFGKEKREKDVIKDRLGSYVDPALVNYVLDHPEQSMLAGDERELSVVFTDLAGFTTISEQLKQETVGLLNQYLALMVPVVQKHRGLINKFLGDGIMFFFGAPEPFPGDPDLHALAAVQTVVEMQQVMTSFNETLMQRGLPMLKMRAGVASGDMVVGDAGNPPHRSDYTVLGDRVNLASRLEGANKSTGTLILLSDRTVELLRGRYLVRPIGRLQVVGKHEPIMTYEPLAPIELATDDMRRLVDMTQAVTDNFAAGRFAECAASAQALLAVFGETSQGRFCELYRRHCLEYMETPPAEFLGQIKLESK